VTEEHEHRPSPDPINRKAPGYKRPSVWITVLLVVALAVTGLVLWDPWRAIRVTDGSDTPFTSYLADVQKLIREENDRVADKAYVSIAFMMPITTENLDPTTEQAIRHQLEGAYLAQFWANHPTGDETKLGSDAPYIRLLIADTGNLGESYEDTVGDLIDRVDSEHLVAVAGLGSSVTSTQSAIDMLSTKSIPTFGAVVTSSKLSADGLVRVAATNQDQAAALAAYLRTTPKWKEATPADKYTAYLVQDIAKEDTYAQDLAAAFSAQFTRDEAHVLQEPTGEFDGRAPAAGNALESRVDEICSDGTDLVFFAGRSADLQTFLGHLGRSKCGTKDLTVVTGDDADHLVRPQHAGSQSPAWGGEFDLLYAGLAAPQSWQANPDLFNKDIVNRFTLAGGTSYAGRFRDDLGDGHAIMGHDAVQTAIAATRNVVDQGTGALQPVPAALSNGINQITANDRVPGASGWIELRRKPPAATQPNTREWLPYNKAVPILRLTATGSTSLVQLSSSQGRPVGAS
jgi:ABC-type branched-subunit amino acid transport system substrate-binding protein